MDSNYQLSVFKSKFSLSKFVELIHKIFLIKIKSEYTNKGSLKFRVDYDKHSCPLYLHTDEKRLMQVILNLLSNSIKFTKAGEIVLKIEMHGDDYLQFKVEDTGPGIPKEVMESFGNSWAKISNNEKNKDGSGLGLSIVCDIINKIGSNLNIESYTMKGTKISFDIKVDDDELNTQLNENDISLKPPLDTESGLSGSSDSSNNSSSCSDDSIDIKVDKILGCNFLEINQNSPPEREKDEINQCYNTVINNSNTFVSDS
jgi:anti-sigma regulatory factor (Ser/Thr protein kinase)